VHRVVMPTRSTDLALDHGPAADAEAFGTGGKPDTAYHGHV